MADQAEGETFFNSKQMARLFDVTPQAINNWKKEGMPCLAKNGVDSYPWIKCHDWWLINKYTGHSSDQMPPKYRSEAKLFQAKAELETLRLEETRRNLIPAAEIESSWVRVATIVKDRVLNIPIALKLRRPKLTADDIAEVRALCRAALEAIAQCPTQP